MSFNKKHIFAYTDGGSRGNPGPAAAAFYLTDENKNEIIASASYLGETTNNIAEYTAVVNALKHAKKISANTLTLYSDSELLVKQLTGQYKVKSEQIKPLFKQAGALLEKFESAKIYHVKREKNKRADQLVNKALNLKKYIEETPGEQPNQNPIRLGVLISGGGTTLMNILDYISQGKLNAEVSIVISSRSKVKGVERAKKAGLNLQIVRKKDYPELETFGKEIEKHLLAANVDLVLQAGWLCYWKMPKTFEQKVMNIHPALLPSFGGKGMFGKHVHQAVLDKGCKVSGCTVHFCNNEYDSGPIIIQRAVEVKDDDTPDTLAKRVFEQECIAYPQAVKLFADGKLIVKNGKVKIRKS